MSSFFKKFLIRRDSLADFDSANPILSSGEPAFALDKAVLKIGNGEHRWQDLESFISTRELKVGFNSVTLPAISENGDHTLSVTVSGIDSNSKYAAFASPSTSLPSGVVISHAYVDSDNTVKVKFTNTKIDSVDGGGANGTSSDSESWTGVLNAFAYMTDEYIPTTTTTTTPAPRTDSYYSFGYNNFGQLGHGDRKDRSKPEYVGNPPVGNSGNLWNQFSLGYYHTLATSSSGTLYGWGYNYYGQIGNGEHGEGKYKSTPQPINGSTSWSKVSAGAYHSLAISGGKLFSWGSNSNGSLGVGDTSHRYNITKTETSYTFEPLSASASGLIVGNKLILNYEDGDTFDSNKKYELPPGSSVVVKTETGYFAAVLSDSNLIRYSGVPGDPLTTSVSKTITGTEYDGTYDFINGQVSIVADGNYGTASIYFFHSPTSTFNFYDAEDILYAQGDDGWTEISAGHYHSLGIKDGYLYGWGNNSFGQLGLGNYDDKHTPQLISTASGWTKVAAGNYHSLAIKGNDIYAFGKNDNGQLGLNVRNAQINIPTQIDSSFNEISLYDTYTLGSISGVRVDGQKYIFNVADGESKAYDSNARYVLDGGSTYVLSGVPNSHPIGFLNDNNSSDFHYTGDNLVGLKTVNGVEYEFYSGNVTITTIGNFETVSAYCLYHGYMGGQDIFLYDSVTANPIEVQAGIDFSIVRTDQKECWSFGKNNVGQLGLGDYDRRIKPDKIKEYNWDAVEVGANHAFLLDSAKRVWAFGDNSKGQLGLSDNFSRNEPTPLNTLERYDDVQAGGNHSVVSIFSVEPTTPVITSVQNANQRNDVPSKNLRLSWSDPLKTEYGVFNYIIQSGAALDGTYSTVLQTNNNNTFAVIDLSSEPSGLYFFKVQSENAENTSAFSVADSGISEVLTDDLWCNTTLLLHLNDSLASSGRYTTTQTAPGSTVSILPSGKYGSGLYFDTAGNYRLDYANATEIDLPNNFAIEFYYKKPTTTNAIHNIICSDTFHSSYSTTNKHGFAVYSSGNKLVCAEQVSGVITEIFSTGILGGDSNFHHFAWTRNGLANTFWQDGVTNSGYNCPSGIPAYQQTKYIIGGTHTNLNDAGFNSAASFVGYLDEFRITKSSRYSTTFTSSLVREFGDLPENDCGGGFGIPPLEFDSAYSYNLDKKVGSTQVGIESGVVSNFNKYAQSGNGLPSNQLSVELGKNFFFDGGGSRTDLTEDNRFWVKTLTDCYVDIDVDIGRVNLNSFAILQGSGAPSQHLSYQNTDYGSANTLLNLALPIHNPRATPIVSSSGEQNLITYEDLSNWDSPFTTTNSRSSNVYRYENIPVRAGDYIVGAIANGVDASGTCLGGSGNFKMIGRQVNKLLSLDFENRIADKSSFNHNIFTTENLTPYTLSYSTDSFIGEKSIVMPTGMASASLQPLTASGHLRFPYRFPMSFDMPPKFLSTKDTFTIETFFKLNLDTDGIHHHRLFALERNIQEIDEYTDVFEDKAGAEAADFIHLDIQASGHAVSGVVHDMTLGFTSLDSNRAVASSSFYGLTDPLSDSNDVTTAVKVNMSGIIHDNTWHHAALVRYYDSVILFVDGTPVISRVIGKRDFPTTNGVTNDNTNLSIPPYHSYGAVSASDDYRVYGAPFTIGPIEGKLDKFEISNSAKYLQEFDKDLLPYLNDLTFDLDGHKYKKNNTYFSHVSGVVNPNLTQEAINTTSQATAFTYQVQSSQNIFFRINSDSPEVVITTPQRVDEKGIHLGKYPALGASDWNNRIYYLNLSSEIVDAAENNTSGCLNAFYLEPSNGDYGSGVYATTEKDYIKLDLFNQDGSNYYQDFTIVNVPSQTSNSYLKMSIAHDRPDIVAFSSPSQPSTLTGTSGFNSVTMNWNAPDTFGGDAITDYIINYEVVGSGVVEKAYKIPENNFNSSGNSVTLNNLIGGSGYEIKVQARNRIGDSILSSGYNITPKPIRTPFAPQNLQFYPTSGAAILDWETPTSDGGADITSYKVRLTPSGGASTETSIGFPSGILRKVVEISAVDTAYGVEVAAVNSKGTGDYSTPRTSGIIQNKFVQGVGENGYGQLGDNSTTDRTIFSDLYTTGNSGNFIEIALCHRHGAVINSSGQLYTFGQNSLGKLGNGTSSTSNASPTIVSTTSDGVSTWAKVATGTENTFAISESGSLYACGQANGLGNNSSSNSSVLVKIGSDDDWVDVRSQGTAHMALKSNGDVYYWGGSVSTLDSHDYVKLELNNDLGAGNLTFKKIFTPTDNTSVSESDRYFLVDQYDRGWIFAGFPNIDGTTQSLRVTLPSSASSDKIISMAGHSTLVNSFIGVVNASGELFTNDNQNFNILSHTKMSTFNTHELVQASGDFYIVEEVVSTSENLIIRNNNGSIFGSGTNTYGTFGNDSTSGSSSGGWILNSGTLKYDNIAGGEQALLAIGSVGEHIGSATTTTTTTTTTTASARFTSTYTTTGDGAAAGSPMRATGNYAATDPVFTVATGFSGNITVTANVSGGSSDYDRNLKVLKNGSEAATLFNTDSWGGTYSTTITVAAGDTIGFLRSTSFITATYVEVQFQ